MLSLGVFPTKNSSQYPAAGMEEKLSTTYIIKFKDYIDSPPRHVEKKVDRSNRQPVVFLVLSSTPLGLASFDASMASELSSLGLRLAITILRMSPPPVSRVPLLRRKTPKTTVHSLLIEENFGADVDVRVTRQGCNDVGVVFAAEVLVLEGSAVVNFAVKKISDVPVEEPGACDQVTGKDRVGGGGG